MARPDRRRRPALWVLCSKRQYVWRGGRARARRRLRLPRAYLQGVLCGPLALRRAREAMRAAAASLHAGAPASIGRTHPLRRRLLYAASSRAPSPLCLPLSSRRERSARGGGWRRRARPTRITRPFRRGLLRRPAAILPVVSPYSQLGSRCRQRERARRRLRRALVVVACRARRCPHWQRVRE